MIKIINLRIIKPSEPYDFYIDRRRAIGNPFYMRTEADRDRVCNAYEEWFKSAIKELGSDSIIHSLIELRRVYKKYGRLRLFCWCAPKRCHGETIKKYIEENK